MLVFIFDSAPETRVKPTTSRVVSKGIEWSHSIEKCSQTMTLNYSNCAKKLPECSLAGERKFFATARLLGFSLRKYAHAMNALRLNVTLVYISQE